MSIPRRRQAPRIVSPSKTRTDCPSISSSIIRFGASSSLTRTPQTSDRRFDRARRSLTETADRRVAHALADLGDHCQLLLDAADRLAGDEPRERLLLAHGADAAGHALAARLVAEERGEAQQQPRHVDRLVEHEHDAQPSVVFASRTASKVSDRSSSSGMQEAAGGTAHEDALELLAAGDAACEVEVAP